MSPLSDTSHPHVLWGIRGNFARNVVLAKFRRAAAAILAARGGFRGAGVTDEGAWLPTRQCGERGSATATGSLGKGTLFFP